MLQQVPAELLEQFPATLQAIPPAQGHALAKLCLVLFNLSEFAFVD